MSDVKHSFGFPLSITTSTNVGCVRDNNEDSVGHSWLDDESLFVIVADGMGGHAAGEVASSLAVQVVEEHVSQDVEVDPRERLFQALLEANEVILEEGTQSGHRGMGTTAICAIFKGAEFFLGQVGDSRCYWVRAGKVMWRTLDHTRVQMLVDQGAIQPEDAGKHPDAGMLTRALGHARMANGAPLEPEVLADSFFLEENDVLLFCSDGLTDLLEDHEIAEIVSSKLGEEICETLTALACERGGHDNITIAVVCAGRRAGALDPHFEPEQLTYPRAYGEEEPEEPEEEPEVEPITFEAPVLPAPEPVEVAPESNMMLYVVVGGVVSLGLLGAFALLLVVVGFFVFA